MFYYLSIVYYTSCILRFSDLGSKYHCVREREREFFNSMTGLQSTDGRPTCTRFGSVDRAQEIEFFNFMTRLQSTERSTDMHKVWIGRPLGQLMLHEEEEPSWVGRPTFSVSPATTEGIERPTGRPIVGSELILDPTWSYFGGSSPSYT